MLVAEGVLGNVEDDPEFARQHEQRDDGQVEVVRLDERERRRSRIRTTTDAGTGIGIVVEDDRGLRPGDVLVADDDQLVVVEFADREALVVSFEAGGPAAMAAAARLGYRVGNRHWDLAARGDEVVVALGADGERVAAEVEAALPPGARTRRETVDPTLFDDVAGTQAHTHGHDHDHSPSEHTHGHGDEGIRTVSDPGEEGDG